MARNCWPREHLKAVRKEKAPKGEVEATGRRAFSLSVLPFTGCMASGPHVIFRNSISTFARWKL